MRPRKENEGCEWWPAVTGWRSFRIESAGVVAIAIVVVVLEGTVQTSHARSQANKNHDEEQVCQEQEETTTQGTNETEAVEDHVRCVKGSLAFEGDVDVRNLP